MSKGWAYAKGVVLSGRGHRAVRYHSARSYAVYYADYRRVHLRKNNLALENRSLSSPLHPQGSPRSKLRW
jgi:hypothetical protein